MKYVNLTPHIIHLLDRKGFIVRIIEPSGMVARAKNREENIIKKDVVPFYIVNNETKIEFLPPEKKGTIYIVSQIIVRLLNGSRYDVFAPYKLEVIKNKKVGCKGLFRLGAETHVLSNFIK